MADTCRRASWTPTGWMMCLSPTSGWPTTLKSQSATGLTYTVAAADEGKAIKVEVSFTEDVGNDESLTSAATDAVAARPNSLATGASTISGTVQVGETLTANRSGIADGLSKVQYEYQWPLPSGLYRIAPKRAGGG